MTLCVFPFKLADNGVTVVLKSGYAAGTTGKVQGDNSGKIYTAVNETELRDLVKTDEDYDPSKLATVCTTLVTSMGNTSYTSGFFSFNFNEDISHWDTSNVTFMRSLFNECSSFNHPLNNWDVSKVTDIACMFYDATSFNQPLNNWNTISVNNQYGMYGVFKGATSFNYSINNWDVSNVLNMRSMFTDASSFNQPLNNWNTSSVVNMGRMFEGATSFNQPLSNWDVSNIPSYSTIWSGLNSMFKGALAFNQDLSGWCVSEIGSRAIYFDTGADAWVLANSRPIWGTCP